MRLGHEPSMSSWLKRSIVCRATWRIWRAFISGCRSSGSRSMPSTTEPPIPFWSASAASSGRCSAKTVPRRYVAAWLASCVTGGAGMIFNELYTGRLVWNKVRMVKDPDTGKRISRPNPKSEWQLTDVPDLVIISREVFEAAQKRKEARSVPHPNRQRRPRHILSGLLRCGTCGAGMSTNGKDKSERIRIRCSAATESGTCRDAKTFYLHTVECAVLAGLEAEMRHPGVIAEYVRTYLEERKRLSAKANAKKAHLEMRLGELNREIDRLVDAIAKGHGDPAVLGPRSSVLDEEQKQVTKELNLEPA